MYCFPACVSGFGNITPRTQLGQGFTIISCLLGIPITMLFMKTAGELLACLISFLVIKTESKLLKREEPQHVKKKTFLVSFTVTIVLLTMSSVSTIFLENWSFIEGLYAWFVTFTTIGFGDYVFMDSLRRKVNHGKSSNTYLIFTGILFALPYLVGLSLVSCILSVLVDSVDQIRDFRDRCINCCPSLISVIRDCTHRKVTSPSRDVKNEYN